MTNIATDQGDQGRLRRIWWGLWFWWHFSKESSRMLVAFTISTGGSVHSKVWHDGMV